MPQPWYLNILLSDEEFKKYNNRKVNLGKKIAKERGAQYIVVLASKSEEPLKFDFAKSHFFLSVFFYKVFAYILAIWSATTVI